MKKIIILFIVTLITLSCTTTKQKEVFEWSDMKVRIEPDINVITNKDNIEVTVLFSELINNEMQKSFIDSVKSIYFFALSENKVLDSTKKSFLQKRKNNFNDNITLCNLFENYKYRVDSILPKDLNFRIELETSNQKYIKNIKPDLSYYIKEDTNQILALNPSYKINENGYIEFSLKAKRLKSAGEEYIPNSESFRVIVMDMKGRLVFSSNYMMNYLQVIGKVRPYEIGETYNYYFVWNMKDNYQKSIPKGRYKAILTIPAVPKHYSKEINFELE